MLQLELVLEYVYVFKGLKNEIFIEANSRSVLIGPFYQLRMGATHHRWEHWKSKLIILSMEVLKIPNTTVKRMA